jgi:RNA polymerase sigma-70 factor (ECF subfamily)
LCATDIEDEEMKEPALPRPEVTETSPLARLEDIFRRCSPDLHRYVQKRLRRGADVPDLTQEIFERFLRGDWRAKVRNPQAYLFGIASHVIADAMMAEQRGVVTFDSEASARAAENIESSVPDSAESVSFEQELLQALKHLPEAHRAALLLTKRDGLSCKEAAQRMKTTEGTVRVYVCEARAQLKILLKRR